MTSNNSNSSCRRCCGSTSRHQFLFSLGSALSIFLVAQHLLVTNQYIIGIDIDYNNIMNKVNLDAPYYYDDKSRGIIEGDSQFFSARPHPLSSYYPLPEIGVIVDKAYRNDYPGNSQMTRTTLTTAADENGSNKINNLVVMVMTRNISFQRRQTIRSTWAKIAAKKQKQKHDDDNSNNDDQLLLSSSAASSSSSSPLVYFVVGDFCKVPPEYREKDDGKNPLCVVRQGELNSAQYTADAEQYINDVIIPNEKKLRIEQKTYGDIVVMNEYEIYRNIPKKLKASYTFVDRYLPKSIRYVAKVDDDMFVRLDELRNYIDDTFENNNSSSSKEGFFNNSNTMNANRNNNKLQSHRPSFLPPQPLILAGDIRLNLRAQGEGKWKEVSQFKFRGEYPPFPIGSAGHVVSRPIAEYVSTYQDSLFDYQGEDVSLGIWVQIMITTASIDNITVTVQYKKIPGMKTMVGAKFCKDPGIIVIGHDFDDDSLKKCQSFWDEKQQKLK